MAIGRRVKVKASLGEYEVYNNVALSQYFVMFKTYICLLSYFLCVMKLIRPSSSTLIWSPSIAALSISSLFISCLS